MYIVHVCTETDLGGMGQAWKVQFDILNYTIGHLFFIINFFFLGGGGGGGVPGLGGCSWVFRCSESSVIELSNGLWEHLRVCEQCFSVIIFMSTSSDHIYLASSEHFRKYLMTSSEHFVIIINIRN